MIPPRTQNSSVAPTLSVFAMMVDGVEYMPVPMTRFTINKAVEKTPSFLSVHPWCQKEGRDLDGRRDDMRSAHTFGYEEVMVILLSRGIIGDRGAREGAVVLAVASLAVSRLFITSRRSLGVESHHGRSIDGWFLHLSRRRRRTRARSQAGQQQQQQQQQQHVFLVLSSRLVSRKEKTRPSRKSLGAHVT